MSTESETRVLRTRHFDLRQTFAALRYPNYRLWFVGQMVSLVGTWMQSVAQQFLIYQLTENTVYLGAVAAASGVATWFFTLYAGALADRVPRRSLLVVTQTSMMLLAFVLAALTFAGVVLPWHIVVLAFLLGVANAFDAPARQAFVLEMVEREDMANAIALNAMMFNAGTAVGPAVAGLTYALVGPAWCFTINGISFLAVIAALLMMKLKPFIPRAQVTSALDDLREGVRYVTHHRVVLTVIALVGAVSMFGFSYVTLFPAWAVVVLNGDVTTNGLLQSFRGLGALIGALMIAALGRFRAKGKVLTLGTLLFPVLTLIFAFVRWLPLSLLVLLGTGWANMILLNMANVLVQTHVADELRGRVMGIYTFVFFGFMPIGALLAGTAANYIGEQVTVALAASVLLLIGVGLYLFVPRLRALEG